ncbi:hypothetical protein L208DRAFT_1320558, partial [Tricholoma matsutake]
NCLVAMRPKSILLNLPTTYDVIKHLHNEFIRWIDQLKQDIEVCSLHSKSCMYLSLLCCRQLLA